MNVKLVSVTPDAEQTMAYIARVSNPANQNNEKFAGLLKYCIKHNHWSVFEQSTMTLEIETTRAIAAQILRHRSFTYQEFSQRYADSFMLADSIPLPKLRRQDEKNRQNSIDDLDARTWRCKGMCSHGTPTLHAYQNLHDWLLPFMDSLHHSSFCQRNPTGTHGYCT